eukprot:PhF_6_TR2296/c1_g1_i1/m.4021
MFDYVAETIVMATVIFLVCVYVMHYYFRKNVKSIEWWIHVIHFFSLLICLAPPLLLVVDIDAATAAMYFKQTKSFVPWLKPVWSTVFWSTQILSWIVLPVVQEYVNSGEFGTKKRLWSSIKLNIKLYVIIGVVCVALLIYVFAAHVLQSPEDLQEIGMCASNAFGLILLILLLSIGLVSIPKNLWRLGSKKTYHKDLVLKVPMLLDELDNARSDWDQKYYQVMRLVKHYSTAAVDEDPHEAQNKQCVDQIVIFMDSFEKDCGSMNRRSRARSPSSGRVSDDESNRDAIVDLHAQVKKNARTIAILDHDYDVSTKTCKVLEAGTGWYWDHVRVYAIRGCAILLALLSLIILWSEAVIPFTKEELGNQQVSVVEHMIMGYFQQNIPILQTVLLGVIIGYMGIAAYWSMFQFKVLYALTPAHCDPAAMSFILTQATRVIMPLCYNFLNMADLTSARTTLVQYSIVFGDMDVVVFLGPWFNHVLPITSVVLSFVVAIGLLPRLARCFGVDMADVYGSESERTEEGEEMVSRVTTRAEAKSPTTTPTSKRPNGGLEEGHGGSGPTAPVSIRDKYRKKPPIVGNA